MLVFENIIDSIHCIQSVCSKLVFLYYHILSLHASLTQSLFFCLSLSRYPGLLREMLPQDQYEQREPADMPPPQSRLLQYRQVQPRSPGDLPSPSSSSSNHTSGPNPFTVPGPPSFPDTSRELHMGGQPFQQHQAFHQASYSLPPEHAAGPIPVKYLLQEAHWPHPGLPQSHVLGHGMPFGLQAMAHRQEQGPLTQLQHQQQKQQLQAPQSSLHSVEEVRALVC